MSYNILQGTVEGKTAYVVMCGGNAIREFDSEDQAAEFIHYLNGGMRHTDFLRMAHSMERAAEALQSIQRTMPR
jgi:hypothetical protein